MYEKNTALIGAPNPRRYVTIRSELASSAEATIVNCSSEFNSSGGADPKTSSNALSNGWSRQLSAISITSSRESVDAHDP